MEGLCYIAEHSSGTTLNNLWRRHLPGVRLCSFFFLFFGPRRLIRVRWRPRLRRSRYSRAATDRAPNQLVHPGEYGDRTPLARWRGSVGPPVVVGSTLSDSQPHDALTIVSWNTAVGAADIVGFVRSLPNPRGR